MRSGIASEPFELFSPCIEAAIRNIRLAGVIQYGTQVRVPNEPCSQYVKLCRSDQCIEYEAVCDHCLERLVERRLREPLRIGNILNHRTQAFERAAAVSNQCRYAPMCAGRLEIYPPHDAGNKRMRLRKLKQ